MKKLTYHLAVLLFCFGILSCSVPTDELEPTGVISSMAMDALFDEGEHFRVVLYKLNSRQKEIVYIDNATVEIFSNENELLETLEFHGENDMVPCYQSTYLKAEAGKSYTVKAQAPGFRTSTWTGSAPLPSNVTSTQRDDIGGVSLNFVSETMHITATVEDTNPLEENYFIINFLHVAKLDLDNNGVIDPFDTDPMKVKKFSQRDPGIQYFDERRILLTDRSFVGGSRELIYRVQFEPGVLDYLRDKPNYGQVITELHTIGKDYYDYLVSYNNKADSDNPFSQSDVIDFSDPSSSPGIFSGISTNRDTTTIIQ